jgi:hypothetical protein
LDNDETNPKAQCQDGIDNDGDGLKDLNDPGCPNNQGNNEGCATTKCQDGIDNDNDGATDYPADFSCSSPLDNDETNPKAQCQDGIDNDGDGLKDLNDPGCPNNQGNNEGCATTKCQDGIDNDNDGATDYPADFSCSSPLDNDETNPKAQCQDGSDNDGDGLVDYPQDLGCSSSTDNDEYNLTSACSDGRDNDNDGKIDYPADPGCSGTNDTNEDNPTLPRVTPIAECVQVNQDGSLVARFGYTNAAPVSSAIPVGPLNFFTPGALNRGQPEAFLPGRMSNVFTVTVPAGTAVTWIIGESMATANVSSTRCQADTLACINTDNSDTFSRLDRLAKTQQSNILRITARVLRQNVSKQDRASAEKLNEMTKATYLQQWTEIWSVFPRVSKACDGCPSVDLSGQINQVLSRAQRLNRLARQAGLLLRKARGTKVNSDERALISASSQIYDRFVETARLLPRITSRCS